MNTLDKISSGHIEKLNESTGLAIEAVSKILKWIEFIGNEIHNKLLTHYNTQSQANNALRKFYPIEKSTAFSIATGYVCLAAPQNYKWVTRGKEKLAPEFFYVIISLCKSGDRKYYPQIGWGVFTEWNKTVTNLGSLDLARELLDVVNKSKRGVNTGEVDAVHAKGKFRMQWRPFFEYDSQEKVGALAEEIDEDFKNWLVHE